MMSEPLLPKVQYSRLGGRLLFVMSLAGIGFLTVHTAVFGPGRPAVSASAADAAPQRGPTYTVNTHRQSYFRLDENGGLVERDGLPFRDENIYRFKRTIDPATTAIVVMDPWIDMASKHLNDYFGRIAGSRVVPLVKKGLQRGHRVIVLTNDPGIRYNTKIHPELAVLVEAGQATLLYHQDLDDDQFAEHLRKDGINALIYTGFASNMCVIGRRMGMIPMVQQGFKTFFVPEASAAVETEETWETGAVHRETTNIIAQWIAEIVHYEDFMQAEPPK